MCGEQRLCPELLCVSDMLDNRPGDREAVVGGCPAPDLIENQKRVLRRLAENIRHLAHFHHEGGLAARQIVRGTDPRENAVDNSDIRRSGRDKAPDLRHQHNQGALPHIGRLSGHVRTGDDADPVFMIVQYGVVGDELSGGHHLLHNRMSAFPDVDGTAGVDLRADIAVALRDNGKRAEYICLSQRPCGLLDPQRTVGDLVPELHEQVIFQLHQPVLRPQDGLLQLFQLRRDVTLRIHQRLLADIILGNLSAIAVRDLQIIAEDLVVADFHFLDASPLLLTGLDVCKPLLPVRLRRSEVIDLLAVSLSDKSALPHGDRRIIDNGLPDQAADILQRVNLLPNGRKKRRLKLLKCCLDRRNHAKRGFQGDQISRICRHEGDSGDQPFQIIYRPQIFPQLLPRDGVLVQLLDCRQPGLDLFTVHKRLLKEGAKQPCPHRRLRLIQHPEKRASPVLLPQRLRQLQVSPCEGVEHHVLSDRIGLDRCQVFQLRLLRLRQIPQRRSCCRHARIHVRKAKPLKISDMEMVLDRLSALFIIEVGGIQREDRRAGLVLDFLEIQPCQLERIVADDFRR